jgi:hypothetical protein
MPALRSVPRELWRGMISPSSKAVIAPENIYCHVTASGRLEIRANHVVTRERTCYDGGIDTLVNSISTSIGTFGAINPFLNFKPSSPLVV